MPRIKTGRSFTVDSMCDFTEAEKMHKNLESSSELKAADGSMETKTDTKITTTELKEETILREAKEESDATHARNSNMISAYTVEDKGTKNDGRFIFFWFKFNFPNSG